MKGPPNAAERSLALAFEPFGWEALEELARTRESTVGEEVASACVRYLNRLHTKALSLGAPTFRGAGRYSRPVAIELQPDQWAALEREADSRGVVLERVIEHASILAFVAES